MSAARPGISKRTSVKSCRQRDEARLADSHRYSLSSMFGLSDTLRMSAIWERLSKAAGPLTTTFGRSGRGAVQRPQTPDHGHSRQVACFLIADVHGAAHSEGMEHALLAGSATRFCAILAVALSLMTGGLGGCSAGSSNEALQQRSCAARFCAEVRFDAGGGAATSTYSSVYVSTKDGADRRVILSGDNMDHLALRWYGERTLQIRYSGGTIGSFTNTWSASRTSGNVGGDVEAVLLKVKGS